MKQLDNTSAILHEIYNSATVIECTIQLMAKRHPELTTFESWDTLIDELKYLRQTISSDSHQR